MPGALDPVDAAYTIAAADACDAAAARLAEVRRGQAAAAASATDGWLGAHRDRFDRDLAATASRSEQVEVRLRRFADDLRNRSAAERQRSERQT